MPIVSPGGIVTPADSDGWDLTTDLATMATSIDSAVSAANAGANAFKGTASDRGLFTSTATPGMLWQDTDGIGMLWKRGVSGWVPAVWRWSGTAAERTSFTSSAPEGFEWYSTTDSKEYVRVGGAWAREVTVDVDYGGTGSLGANANWGEYLYFGVTFLDIPQVTLHGATSASIPFWLGGLDTTRVYVRGRNISSSTTNSNGPRIIATGMVAA